MRRTWQTVTIVSLLLGSSVAMAEGPLLRFWRDVSRTSARNNAWPDPFVPDDREAVRTPLDMMANNGWRYNNILSDYHFDGNGRLNEAGERMVQNVLQQYPTGRRCLYVLRANDPVVSDARTESVYAAANRYVLPGDTPQVGETVIRPEGWPASFVVATDRLFTESMPQPRLPARSSGGSSSSAAGS